MEVEVAVVAVLINNAGSYYFLKFVCTVSAVII